MRYLLVSLLSICLLLSPLVSQPISQMSTQEILTELSDNTQSIVDISNSQWYLSVDYRKLSERLQEDLNQSNRALKNSQADNVRLETLLLKSDSSVTEMTDLSKNLADDLSTEKQRNKTLKTILIVETALLIVVGGIAYFK